MLEQIPPILSSMMTKTTPLLGVLLLVAAACSGGTTRTATEQDSGGLSLASTSSTVGAPPEEGDRTSGSASANASVTPALGVSVSASDSFDADHLIAGPGSNFVSMDNPIMVPASDVTWMSDDTIVMGLSHESGESHAYPVGQMAYHHIANTTIAGEPFLVTY